MSSLLAASIESFGYPGAGAPLFRDIHLSLQAGDLLLVSGPGGCGKSAFCYCLANVIPGFYTAGELEGSVSIDGVQVTGMPLAQSARYVGLLLQAPERHLCHLSVGEDIAFGPENRAQPPGAIARTVADLAGRLELEHLLARSPHTLSAGEAQRAALAATLALDPPVLVFDQPTAHLDTRARQAFYQLVERLCREEGKILVIAETDQRRDDLQPLATQRLDLGGSERFPFLGTMGPPNRAQDESAGPRLGAPAGRPALPGRQFHDAISLVDAPDALGAGGPPLLALEDVSFAYPGGRPVLEIPEFTLARGECAVLLGENGAGKTTLLRTLAGFCTPQRGRIRLLGHDITRLRTAQRAAQIAYLPRNPNALLTHNSAIEEIVAVIGRVPGAIDSAQRWLEQAGLAGQAAAHPLTLSHGERYRLALAVLLARGPSLLLLDEPTSMLDRVETARLCRLIAAFCAGGGSALLVTHDPEHLARYGIIDRALYLAGQRLMEAALETNILFSQRRSYEHSLLGCGGEQ